MLVSSKTDSARRCHWLLPAFALAVLSSAFLVFQVQPIISRFILPWYGGSPAVWTVCMLFFQVTLFAGYAYAFATSRWLLPRIQGLVHLALVIAALAALPITPTPTERPDAAASPTWSILCLLAASVGGPYFVLSSTGPLLQSWFGLVADGRSPYRLYALSNFGSLLALVSYPFVFEPYWSSTEQSRGWSLGFAVFGLAGGLVAWWVWTRRAAPSTPTDRQIIAQESPDRELPPTRARRATWLLLAGCASLMLLATTNHVCQDVPAAPFLWVAPLAIYLVSFILCFEFERWYSSRVYGIGAALAIVAVSLAMLLGAALHVVVEVGLYFTGLFFVCMLCHGELARRKPGPCHLTTFYLMVAAGGAAGGVFVALIAPRIFSNYLELNLGLLACYVLAVAAARLRPLDARRRLAPTSTRWQTAGVVAAFVGLLVVVRSQAGAVASGAREVTRSFHGVVSVDELDRDRPEWHRLSMRHGRIGHGAQFLAPEKRHLPCMYASEATGIGLVFRHWPQPSGRRVGVVGLGAGMLAAYGRTGDVLRFYEINPEVVRLARTHFTFLADCAAETAEIVDDGRLALEREPPQRFDILVLDAFSGDAIPTHLLTREALQIYLRHLRPDGLIAIHISNRHVDLEPVTRGLAEAGGLEWLPVHSVVDFGVGEMGEARWVLLTRNATFATKPAVREAVSAAVDVPSLLWTDERSSLWQVLK